jgi:hypothetical protein
MRQLMTRDNSMSPRGLLSRRGMMRGSLVAAGSTVAASLALVEEAKAEADIPSWLRVPGEPVRSYGQPAETETDVKRAPIQIYKDLAPAYQVGDQLAGDLQTCIHQR